MTDENEEVKLLIIENLKNVYDPEIPIASVYELGLIYSIQVDLPKVKITHTLTSAFCPFAEQICMDIRLAGLMIDAVQECDIITTFDPPFTPEMMSDEIRLTLGI